MAVAGDTVIVGASGEDSNATGVNAPLTGGSGTQASNSANSAGAAFVFARSGNSWSQQAYLKASNTGADDGFGNAVTVSGDTVGVGARYESSNATGVNALLSGGAGTQADNSASRSGAAYVFVRDGSNWNQQAYLKASNTGIDDRFGWAVSASGDTLVIGAVWEGSDAVGVNAPLAGGTGTQASNSAPGSGAAYVFTRNNRQWSQQAYLKASNTGIDDRFGSAVAVLGDTIVTGAPQEGSNATGVNAPRTGGSGSQADNTYWQSGAAYVFVRSSAAWNQQAYLKASNPGLYFRFGESVAVSLDGAVAGSFSESSNATGVNAPLTGGSGTQADYSAPNSGAVYVFNGVGLVPSDGIQITRTAHSGGSFIIDFTAAPGLTGWAVKGSAELAGFPDDLTSVTVITESLPGTYRAVIDLTGRLLFRYFLRIER